jgi:primosomal protein N' (replication factor Y)
MGKEQTKSLFPTEPEKEIQCHHIIRVAFETAADTEFDYLVPDELWPIQSGQRVKVPFGRKDKQIIGFCIESDVPIDKSFVGQQKSKKLKRIIDIVDKEPLLNPKLMQLAHWISGYYVCPLGQVLAAMVPGAVKRSIGVRTEKYIYLASRDNKDIENLRGTKQIKVVGILQQYKAFDMDSLVKLQEILQKVHSGKEPVKRLVEKQIVKIAEKTVLRSLPAIPKGMSIHSGKVVLNEDQKRALKHINEKIDSGKFSVTLLHGVTDSGKTELYIRAIEAILQKGKRAIVLLPEIALTAQTVQRFSARFERIAVMHSGLTASQRNAQWQKIKSGDADVVIGARSAIFSPLTRLGLIVVDEEHEPSYKQDTAPRYHGRDVAIKRAQLENAYCILGSATPSLETLTNCRNKEHFSLVRLRKRVMNLPMPQMRLIDLRRIWTAHKGVNLITEPLTEHLRQILSKKEQAILLLNRRGYSNFIFCPSCKHTLHCNNCDVTLTFHKSDIAARSRGVQTVTGRHISYGYAICHYCLAQTLVPEKCPICGVNMAMIGMGSQRLIATL